MTDGQLLMAFDHDVYDIIPTDTSDFAETRPNIIGHIGSYLNLNVSRFPTLYTRGTTIPPGDLKTYDLGRLFIATNGTATSATAYGTIRVHYRVALYLPQPHAGVPGSSLQFLTGTGGIISVVANELEGCISNDLLIPS